MRRILYALATVMATALLLTSCGGNGAGGNQKKAEAAVKAVIEANDEINLPDNAKFGKIEEVDGQRYMVVSGDMDNDGQKIIGCLIFTLSEDYATAEFDAISSLFASMAATEKGAPVTVTELSEQLSEE